tara:strand:+ start:60 stop:374 length:315 start_codon:yes stop_codon:yes gene_type:complete
MNIVGNLKVAGKTRLTADCATLAQLCATCKPNLPRNRGSRTNGDAVRDVYQIVDDDIVFNHSVVQRATINGTTGTNFHPIANADGTQLENLLPPTACRCEPETI